MGATLVAAAGFGTGVRLTPAFAPRGRVLFVPAFLEAGGFRVTVGADGSYAAARGETAGRKMEIDTRLNGSH